MTRLLTTLAFLVVAAATAEAQAAPRPVHYYNAAWSPDSRTLAFESDRDSAFAIYRVEIDGSGLRKLTSGSGSAYQPAWSPDGKTIVFSSNGQGNSGLTLMNADGTGRRPLVPGQDTPGFSISYSPDGQWIVAGVQLAPRSDKYAIAVIRADGTGRRVITDSTRVSTSPAWSPDDQRIVFQQTSMMLVANPGLTRDDVRRMLAQRDSSLELFSMRVDGSDVRQLTRDKTYDCCPNFSRDGSMYFTSDRDGPRAVYAMSRDGTIRRTDLPDTNVSPDGRWVAYTKEVAGVSGVYLYEVATKTERLLVGGAR